MTTSTRRPSSTANRSSVYKLTEVRQVPERVQFDVLPRDLRDDGADRFLRKFERALRSAAREIQVNLVVEGPLTSGALGVLLRARNDAHRKGCSFRVRPHDPSTVRFLAELGLAEVLGAAA